MKKYDLSIPTPCTADTTQMQSTKTGFFCTICSENVHDLTQKTPEEIDAIVEAHKGNMVCVKMLNSQLSKAAVALAASLMLGTPPSLLAQNVPLAGVPMVAPTEQPKQQIKKGKAFIKPITETITITGVILDEKTLKTVKKYHIYGININGQVGEYDTKTGKFKVELNAPKEGITEFPFHLVTNEGYEYRGKITIKIKEKKAYKKILVNIEKFRPELLIGKIAPKQ